MVVVDSKGNLIGVCLHLYCLRCYLGTVCCFAACPNWRGDQSRQVYLVVFVAAVAAAVGEIEQEQMNEGVGEV